MPSANADQLYRDTELHVQSIYARDRQILPAFPIRGREWFLDGNTGAATADGRSFSSSKLTMADIFDELSSGDVIYFTGNIAEQLDSPAGIHDVTIIGACNRPRHPDAHTGNSGYTSARWKLPTSPTAATPCLRIRQQGWRLMNFLMTADTSQECVQLFRDAGAGDSERDASHADIIGMRFDGAGVGIMVKGGPNFVNIRGNLFRGMTTGVANTTGAGVGTNAYFDVKGNRFLDNTNHFVVPLNQGMVYENIFSKHTTLSLSLSGGTGSNIVTKNYMSGTYSVAGGYVVANANDEWAGNFNTLSGGITVSDPA